jgi:hypothetical protein
MHAYIHTYIHDARAGAGRHSHIATCTVRRVGATIAGHRDCANNLRGAGVAAPFYRPALLLLGQFTSRANAIVTRFESGAIWHGHSFDPSPKRNIT